MMMLQDYPHDQMEWIIIDDSDDAEVSRAHATAFPSDLNGITVRYYRFAKKIPLARKRDHLNHQARGKYIVNIDDDDYYPPTRVSHAVATLKKTGASVVGSSIMFMYYLKDKKIRRFGPYRNDHGSAATMAYTKDYADKHRFGSTDYAEESTFTESWSINMPQLDPMQTVLALSHSDNTIDKTMYLKEEYDQRGNYVHETDLTLETFIKDQQVREFYGSLPYIYKQNEISKKVEQSLQSNTIKNQQEVLKSLMRDLTRERIRYEIEMTFLHEIPVPHFRPMVAP